MALTGSSIVGALPTVLFVAVFIVQIRKGRAFASRAGDLQSWGAQEGLRFIDHASVPETDLRFQFFTDHSGSTWFANILKGTFDGIEVFAGDYTYPEGKTSDTVTLAIAQPNIRLEYLSIRRHSIGAMDTLERTAGTTIDFESEAFNRAFQVVADDSAYAHTVIDQKMMDWLLETPQDLLFEVGVGGVLVVAPAIAAETVSTLLGAATGFADHIPGTAGRDTTASPALPPGPDAELNFSAGDRVLAGAAGRRTLSGVNVAGLGHAIRDGSWRTSPHVRQQMFRSLGVVVILLLLFGSNLLGNNSRLANLPGTIVFLVFAGLTLRNVFAKPAPPKD